MAIPYDKNRDHYDALAAYAKKEHDEDQRPAIKNAIVLLSILQQVLSSVIRILQ